MNLGGILVVDDSVLCMQLMSTLLQPYASKVHSAGSAEEAIDRLQGNHAIDLVVCDVVMKGKDGFAVLEHIQELPAPRPKVLLVTARPTDEGLKRASELGAEGYLSKPTTLRQILAALEPPLDEERREVKPRTKCDGTATPLNPETGAAGPLIWDVYNISTGGALLETKGPLVIGSEMDLVLDLRGEQVQVRVRVARVQEPSWLEVGGAGVEFLDPSERARAVIRRATGWQRSDATPRTTPTAKD